MVLETFLELLVTVMVMISGLWENRLLILHPHDDDEDLHVFCVQVQVKTKS